MQSLNSSVPKFEAKMRYILHMKSSYLNSEVLTLNKVFLYLLVLSVLALNACATTNQPGFPDDTDSIPVQSELTGDLLYDLLVGEFAGNAGDMELSVESYNRAAMKTPDARVVHGQLTLRCTVSAMRMRWTCSSAGKGLIRMMLMFPACMPSPT